MKIYFKKLDLNLTEKDHSLPIMYWLPKLNKTPNGARIIIASKILVLNHCQM